MNAAHTAKQIWTNTKKEVWESQRTLIWLPSIIVGLIILVALFVLFTLSEYQWANIFSGFEQLQTRDNFSGFSEVVLAIMQVIMVPFMLIAFIIQVHYCLSCLFDDRKDLSVYFWRSLPVSDVQSVGVKLLVGLLVVPSIFLLAGTILQLLIGLGVVILSSILSIAYDISLWSLVANSAFFTNFIKIWWIMLPFVVWLFPVFAWLILASSVAKRSPFLIAVLPIVAIMLTEVLLRKTLSIDALYFTDTIVNYFSLFEGVESMITVSSSHNSHGFSYANNPSVPFYLADVFVNKISFVATIMGAIFMYAALWMRKNKAS
jgi:ABC-2 type transport system permease protein